MSGQIVTIVYTDGLGTFQARSVQTAWRGPWRRSERKAIEDARVRGEVEAQSSSVSGSHNDDVDSQS